MIHFINRFFQNLTAVALVVGTTVLVLFGSACAGLAATYLTHCEPSTGHWSFLPGFLLGGVFHLSLVITLSETVDRWCPWLSRYLSREH